MVNLVTDSVLPSPLQNQRFLVLESLLKRLDSLPPFALIMLIDITPKSALTAFADQFSLFGDGWEFAHSEDEQRELIKGAIQIHRHKGTRGLSNARLPCLGLAIVSWKNALVTMSMMVLSIMTAIIVMVLQGIGHITG